MKNWSENKSKGTKYSILSIFILNNFILEKVFLESQKEKG